MEDLTVIAQNTIEVTLVDALSDGEAHALIGRFEGRGMDSAVAHSGRIVIVSADDLLDVTPVLADFGLIEDIGHIKHTIDYHVNHKDLNVVVNFH